jgi:hypothetical protein
MTDVLDVLIAARAEVEKGWCKGHLVNDDTGDVCAMGAVYRAAGDDFVTAPVPDSVLAMADRTRRILEDALNGRHVPFFNDASSTTKADVVALFDRAIAAEAVKVTADPAHTYTTAA